MQLSVSQSTNTPQAIVTVSGVLDVYTAPTLRDALDRLIAGGYPHLVIDLTGIEFVDSTGLGVLVGRLKHAKVQEGSIELVLTNERVLKVFTLTGLQSLFTIHATVAEAEAAYGAAQGGSGA